jgi:hypothetical protein
MVLTCLFKYILGLAFEENGRHLPMQLLREKREDPGDISDGEDDTSSDEEENCNAKKQEQKAELRSKWKKAALSAIQLKPETNNESEDLVRPRHSRLVLDEDDYEATPDHRTDYRQPPMQLNPGLLDTGLKKYGNPLLVGILPQLWLPVKKLDDEAPVAQPSHHHNLHHLPNGGKVAQQLAEILRKMESDKGTQRRQSTEEARKAAAQKTAHHIATSFAQKNTSSRGLWLKALHHPSSDTMSTMEEGGEHTGVLLGEKPSTEALLPKNIHGTYYHHPDRRSSAILSRRRPVLQEQSGNHSAPADILFTVHHDEGKDLGENDIREKDGEKKD